MDERIYVFLRYGERKAAVHYQEPLKISHTFSKAVGEGSESLSPPNDRELSSMGNRVPLFWFESSVG